MNEVRRLGPTEGELDRVRAIVDKHLRPDLVSGFSVEFGKYEDEPVMWITFDTVGPRPNRTDKEERKKRAEQLLLLKDNVHRELTKEFYDRYPFYSFAEERHD